MSQQQRSGGGLQNETVPEGEVHVTRMIVHRETHSSRAVPATIAAALIGLSCLYALLESTLKAFGEDPWLLGPEALGQWLSGLPDTFSVRPGSVDHLVLGLAGTLALLTGLLFLGQAVLPGRRTRHSIPNSRAAVVVDAEVLASSLARSARLAAGVTLEQVMVTVARRVVQVRLRPTSGTPVDGDQIRRVIEEELRRTGVEPTPDVQVSVTAAGVVGQ